jgi:uncharacterized oligopeptide transporter (OPT) family protein
MEPARIPDSFAGLTGDIKQYVKLRISLLKLLLTEKLSRLFTIVIMTMVFFILILFVLTFLGIAFLFWFREVAGPAYLGAIIVSGFYLLLGVVIYLLRYPLFLNPVVSQLSKILLEEEPEDE